MEVQEGEVEVTTEVIEETTTEVTPPAAEEQLATLQAQYKELQAKHEQIDKEARSAQATLTRKDKESKAQADLSTRIEGIESSIQILAGMVSKGELSPEDAQAYKKEFEDVKEAQRKQSEQAALKAQDDAYIQKAQSLLGQVAEAGIKEGSVLYETIMADLQDRRYDLASARFRENKPEKNETDDAKIERLAEEKLRQEMEKKGMLNVPTSQPSGSNMNDERWLTEEYGEGKSDDHARAKKILAKMK